MIKSQHLWPGQGVPEAAHCLCLDVRVRICCSDDWVPPQAVGELDFVPGRFGKWLLSLVDNCRLQK